MADDQSTGTLRRGGAPALDLARRRHRIRTPVLGWRSVASGAAAVVTWLAVAAVHGFLPGMSQVPLTATYATGMLTCLHRQGIASLWSWCMETGLPVGAPALTGLPELYFGWVLTYVPGISPWAAHQITGLALDALGIAGVALLVRRWGGPQWVGLVIAVSYLTGPNLLQLNGFAYTFAGYILLPFYLWAAIATLDRLGAARWARDARWWLGAAGALLVALLMAFTDGYSYFGGAVVIGCVVVARAVRWWRTGRRATALAGVVTWAGALGAAAAVYAVWVPGDAYESNAPLEYFGMLGVDVASLFVPSTRFLYPPALGFTPPSLDLWGTTATPRTNYLGYLMAALAVLGVVLAVRRRTWALPEVLGVAGAFVVTFVLALGPTLKVGQYLPGLENSVLTLPTAWLYENVPGFTTMRATNRWLVASRLCLVLLAGYGLTALWSGWRARSRRRGALVVALGVLAVVEVLPNPWMVVNERAASIQRVRDLERGIVAEANDLLRDGETIVMLPSPNDFLADFLVPLVDVRSYNVGIDKNHALSMSKWPAELRVANRDYGGADSADLVCAALGTDVDAVVLPYVSTRSAPLLGNEDPEGDAARQALAGALAADPRFDARVGQWVTVLRAAPGGGCG